MLFFGFGLVCKGDTVMRNRRLARSPSKHILVWSHEYGCAFVGLLQDILPGVREGMICVIVTGCERFDEESRTWVSFPDQRFEWKPVPSIPVDHPYLDGEPTLLFVEGYLTSSSGGAEGLKIPTRSSRRERRSSGTFRRAPRSKQDRGASHFVFFTIRYGHTK